MATITADVPVSSRRRMSGLREALRNMGQSTKNSARTTWVYTKRAGSWLMRTTNRFFRWLGLGVKYAVVTAYVAGRWFLGRVLATGSWLLRGVVTTVTSATATSLLIAFTVVMAVVFVVDTILGGRTTKQYAWQSASLEERADFREQDDYENSPFPGTSATLAISMDDADLMSVDYNESQWPFSNTEGDADTVANALGQWIDEGKDLDAFDFVPWIQRDPVAVAEVMDTIARTGHFTDHERAFWIGRQEGLTWLLADRENVTKHGQGWSLLHSKYQSKAATVPLKYLRTGFMQAIKDMEVALAISS